MNEELLKNFGMTPTEIKVYLELARLNETEIGRIIDNTGLHRGTAFNTLTSLIKKGFVGFVDNENKRLYSPTGDQIFKNILKDKNEELARENKQTEEFLNSLNKLAEQDTKQEVRVFYGVSAFKNLFFEVYDWCKKENQEYLFQGSGGQMINATGIAFYKYTQDLKKKMKLKSRLLADKSTQGSGYKGIVRGDVRYLSDRLHGPVNIWIYGDTTLIVIFETNPLMSIRIKSHTLAESFRDSFETMWKIAKP